MLYSDKVWEEGQNVLYLEQTALLKHLHRSAEGGREGGRE